MPNSQKRAEYITMRASPRRFMRSQQTRFYRPGGGGFGGVMIQFSAGLSDALLDGAIQSAVGELHGHADRILDGV